MALESPKPSKVTGSQMTNQARPCVCSPWATPALVLATPDPGNHPFPSSQWLWRVQNQMWAQMLSVWETGASEQRGHLTSSCFTSSPSPLPTPALFLSSLNPFAPGVCFCAPCRLSGTQRHQSKASISTCTGSPAKQAPGGAGSQGVWEMCPTLPPVPLMQALPPSGPLLPQPEVKSQELPCYRSPSPLPLCLPSMLPPSPPPAQLDGRSRRSPHFSSAYPLWEGAWGLGEAEPYLEDKPIGAGTVILVHLVDNQEDNTGEEGQGEEDQHGDLWVEVGPIRVTAKIRVRVQPDRHTDTLRCTKRPSLEGDTLESQEASGTRGQQNHLSLNNFLTTSTSSLYCKRPVFSLLGPVWGARDTDTIETYRHLEAWLSQGCGLPFCC